MLRRLATTDAKLKSMHVSIADLAMRTCVTQLLLTRWALEQSAIGDARTNTAYTALLHTIETNKLDQNFTTHEKLLFEMPLSKWDDSDHFQVEPRWESFGVLLWSIRIFKEMPDPWLIFPRQSMYTSTNIVPAQPDSISVFLNYFQSGPGAKADHVVDYSQFIDQVNRAEAWYWRSKAQQVLDFKRTKPDTKKIPPGLRGLMGNIENAIEQGSIRAREEGFIETLVDGDFGVKGAAYRDLTDHDSRDIGLNSEARMAALAWMAGHPWDYERGQVPFVHPMGSLWST